MWALRRHGIRGRISVITIVTLHCENHSAGDGHDGENDEPDGEVAVRGARNCAECRTAKCGEAHHDGLVGSHDPILGRARQELETRHPSVAA